MPDRIKNYLDSKSSLETQKEAGYLDNDGRLTDKAFALAGVASRYKKRKADKSLYTLFKE